MNMNYNKYMISKKKQCTKKKPKKSLSKSKNCILNCLASELIFC